MKGTISIMRNAVINDKELKKVLFYIFIPFKIFFDKDPDKIEKHVLVLILIF